MFWIYSILTFVCIVPAKQVIFLWPHVKIANYANCLVKVIIKFHWNEMGNTMWSSYIVWHLLDIGHHRVILVPSMWVLCKPFSFSVRVAREQVWRGIFFIPSLLKSPPSGLTCIFHQKPKVRFPNTIIMMSVLPSSDRVESHNHHIHSITRTQRFPNQHLL